MAISLKEVRAKYPRYAYMGDAEMLDALYDKYYRDMPRQQFDKKLADSGDVVEQVLSGFTSAVDAIPVVGPPIMDGLEQVKSWVHGVPVETIQTDTERMQVGNPDAAGIGDVVGTALPFVAAAEFAVPAKLLGLDAAVSVVPRTAAGVASQQALAVGDKMMRSYKP